jgi:hypothetical protein
VRLRADVMTSRASIRLVPVLTAALATSASVPACAKRDRAPSMVLTQIPEASDGGPERVAAIAGRVTGARAGQHVVLFAKSGVWWVQPFVNKAFTDIAADGTWKNSTHLGLEYAALLVDATYQPPATLESLPAPGGGVLAVVTEKGRGSYVPPQQHRLTFSGYEWEIRQMPSERGGLNDYDPRNAWVDDSGKLHLLLTQRDGKWTSAEVRLTRSLGYGTYTLVVDDTSHLDPAAALGFLTWDELGADQNHRELDIEVGRWGNPDNKDAQFVVQPHYVAANVYRFALPAGRLTHSFRWESERATFRTVTATGAVAATESVRINLLYYRKSPKPPSGPVEVVVDRFVYLP